VAVDPFYRDVARLALRVARIHGFVLGGGVAWVVSGLVQRPTEDIDLFTDTDGGVANRREVRDYIDVAAALSRYPLQRVLELAHAADPALDPGDIAEAGRYLDRLDDSRFAVYGVDGAQVRKRLTDWPR
jgi:hypothetical protein